MPLLDLHLAVHGDWVLSSLRGFPRLEQVVGLPIEPREKTSNTFLQSLWNGDVGLRNPAPWPRPNPESELDHA